MKRIAVYLTISHFTFTCGVAAALFWNGIKTKPTVVKQTPANTTIYSPPAIVATPIARPHREIVFGDGRLRIVTHQVRLKSERLRYDIDVSYPEIVGATDPHIEKLNRHLRKLATNEYQWAMNFSKADLRYYEKKYPDAFNIVALDYEIRLATDSVLSIYFMGSSSAMWAAYSVPYSFTVNYDLTLRKELKLSDIFKRPSNTSSFSRATARTT